MLHLFLKHLNFVQQKFQFLIEDRETKIGKGKKKYKWRKFKQEKLQEIQQDS